VTRKGAGSDLLLISKAVAQLKDGMYGGLPEPKFIADIKKNVAKGEQRPSIGWGAQKEDAVGLIYKAVMQGGLSVFVLPDLAEGEAQRAPLQVPQSVLEKMMLTRGGLPDRAIEPMRIFAREQVAPELLTALSRSELYLQQKQFKAWYEKDRKKGNWPSQRSSKKKRMGRPSKQIGLRIPISEMVNSGRWSAAEHFVADLVRLLKSAGRKESRQTVERTVAQLHRETGDPRYYYVDPRKRPDDSVWGSFEDLMNRSRRRHRK
jgi:hypothetical protein